MSDWYARKLAEIQGRPPGQAQQPQQPAGPQYPPTAPPQHQPGQLPPHLAPYAQPVQGPPGQQTPQAFVGAQPGQQPQQFYSYNAETGAQVADDGHVALLYNSAAQTGGSKEVLQNSTNCPECRGDKYFTIPTGGVMNKDGQRVLAAQCADCGYPKVQSGSAGGALTSVRSSGPARAARQLPSNHRVGVVVEGGRTEFFEPPTGAR